MQDNKVIDIKPFINMKEWDKSYSNFCNHLDKYFDSKTDVLTMVEKLYFTLNYLSNLSKTFYVLERIGVDRKEIENGKKIALEWLKEIEDYLNYK